MQKKDEENQKSLTTKTDIGWGHQIRSYVLQPYQLVKDLRSKIESTNPSKCFGWKYRSIYRSRIKKKMKKTILQYIFIFIIL